MKGPIHMRAKVAACRARKKSWIDEMTKENNDKVNKNHIKFVMGVSDGSKKQ